MLDLFRRVNWLSNLHSEDFQLAKIFCERLDPDSDLGRGNTLLHTVLGYNGRRTDQEMELVEVLLQRGANPSRRNVEGQTPLAILFESLKREAFTERIAQMLVDKGAEVSQRVIIKAARRFPKNERIQHQLLQRYAQQLLGAVSEPTSESHSTLAEQQWWDQWVHVARAGNRTAVQHVLLPNQLPTYPDASPRFIATAFAVLVETVIWAAKERVSEDLAEKESERKSVADLLRLCRSHKLPVDMACFDYLVELCL